MGRRGWREHTGMARTNPSFWHFYALENTGPDMRQLVLEAVRRIKGHMQGGWNALPAAVPQLGPTNMERQSSEEPAKYPTPG